MSSLSRLDRMSWEEPLLSRVRGLNQIQIRTEAKTRETKLFEVDEVTAVNSCYLGATFNTKNDGGLRMLVRMFFQVTGEGSKQELTVYTLTTKESRWEKVSKLAWANKSCLTLVMRDSSDWVLTRDERK